jgi:Mg/Co/Ni transporter MgtE
MSNKNEKWYVVLGELIVHTIIGLAYFAAMAVPAVIIYKVNKWLTAIGVEGFTMTMLYVAEATFLLFDFYAICRYIYLSVRKNH